MTRHKALTTAQPDIYFGGGGEKEAEEGVFSPVPSDRLLPSLFLSPPSPSPSLSPP